MAEHAAAYTHRRSIRRAEILAALSFVTDMGAGKPMGHAIRACFLGMAVARQLRLSATEQAELYYSFLLMHSGCTGLSLALSPVIKGDELAAIGDMTLRDDANLLQVLDWMRQNVSPDAPLATRIRNIMAMLSQGSNGDGATRGACEVASRVAERLGLPNGVQTAVRYYLERWDGKGPFGLRGSEIPLSARILHASLKFEAHSTARGRAEAETALHMHEGQIFDPRVVEALGTVIQSERFWQIFGKEDLWTDVLDLEPESPYRYIDEANLDDVALAVADFVDLKCSATAGHSRETAGIAEAMARRMGLREVEVAQIRRAGLMHDLGHVALPSHILTDRDNLNEVDKEKLRLHPYYTERVLSRVPAFASEAVIAGRHHERLNGTGYHRGLSGSEIPLPACILAVAEDYEERRPLTGRRAEAADTRAILAAMQPDVGTALSSECFTALCEALDVAAPKPRPRQAPAGLTEREIEVLQLVATGATNRQIAEALVVSEKTVGHHLEHIYNKIGVSSRAAAVFFAMEHELIS